MNFRQAALTLILAGLPVYGTAAQAQDWSHERDQRLGVQFSYPPALFTPVAGDGKPSFHYYASADGKAKLLAGAFSKEQGETPANLKAWLVKNAGGAAGLTYAPQSRNWFVLSGYRDDQIYYEKVMFSCGGKLVNLFAIAYPTAQRARYDPVVERMENEFSPGRNCAGSASAQPAG